MVERTGCYLHNNRLLHKTVDMQCHDIIPRHISAIGMAVVGVHRCSGLLVLHKESEGI